MTSLILVQNIKAGQRGIHYLPLLNILNIFDSEMFTCPGEKKNALTFQLSIMAFKCFKMTLDVSFALCYDYAFTFSTVLAGTTRFTNELGVAACRHFSKRTNLNNDKFGKRKAKISILTLMGFLCVTQSQSIDRTAVARMVAWISFQKGGAG